MQFLGLRLTHRTLWLLPPLFLALSLNSIAAPCAKPQSQQAKAKCSPVPVRKIKYELPKNLKGFKSGPTIKYVIEMDGSVSNVTLVKSSGSNAVDEVVLDAVKKSSYRPLKPGCGPIDSTATIIIDFN
jgi:TonB family protein